MSAKAFNTQIDTTPTMPYNTSHGKTQSLRLTKLLQGYGWAPIDPELNMDRLVLFDPDSQPVPVPVDPVSNLQVVFGYSNPGECSYSLTKM